MLRNFLALGVCSMFLIVGASVAEAGAISARNPFRTFNLSGVNYGSQQWERDHRGQRVAPNRGTRLLGRPLLRGR